MNVPSRALLLVVWVLSGCSASTVLSRPPKKNLSILTAGASRGMLVSEFGQPAYSKEAGGTKIDTFAFDKGVSGGYKFGRAFLHIAADIVTLALWEIVAWPGEKLAAGNNTQVEVSYDPDEKVKTVNYLKVN